MNKICRYGLSYVAGKGIYCGKFKEYRGKRCYEHCKDFISLSQERMKVSEKKIEYLYKCPKCGKEFWDSMYTKPFCLHGEVAYETRHVEKPTHHEECGAEFVTREVNKE